MSLEVRHVDGQFYLDDRYDLTLFTNVPHTGPYATRQEAEAAAGRIQDLVAGSTPD